MAWETLLSVMQENAADKAAEQITAFPNDGTPLETAPNGGLFCPFDGWRQ